MTTKEDVLRLAKQAGFIAVPDNEYEQGMIECPLGHTLIYSEIAKLITLAKQEEAEAIAKITDSTVWLHSDYGTAEQLKPELVKAIRNRAKEQS